MNSKMKTIASYSPCFKDSKMGSAIDVAWKLTELSPAAIKFHPK